MWTVPRQLEDPEERCHRLIAAYDEAIERLQAAQPVPFWDGEQDHLINKQDSMKHLARLSICQLLGRSCNACEAGQCKSAAIDAVLCRPQSQSHPA
jgi:hypothetical protein